MKSILLSTAAFLFIQFLSFGQIVSIPDFNFKNCLVSNPAINTNGNAEIEVSEASNFADSIICFGMGIYDPTGIEAFTNVKFVSLVNNFITSIDVTQNIALEELILAGNGLTSLDVTQNINLKRLAVAFNTSLNSVDLTSNTQLIQFYCEQSGMSSLDLSSQGQLKLLVCSGANLSGNLDLTSCGQLEEVQCYGNAFTSIDVSQCPNLKKLDCYANQIGSLDVSNNLDLVKLQCFINNLTTIDVTMLNDLERFDCAYNQISTLDLSNNPNLETVYCFENNLTSLDMASGGNQNIDLLWTNGNNLTCIKVDDSNYSTSNWVTTSNSFQFDNGTVFDENCGTNSLTEIEQLEIKLFPNPAVNETVFASNSDGTIQIISAQGVLITELKVAKGENHISLDDFAQGIYYYRFKSEGNTIAVLILNKL